jgi:type I restriction enzyme, S subunit
MAGEWPTATVLALQHADVLLVEDGNHGEYRPRADEFVADGVAFIRAADMEGGRVLFETASKINKQARARITKGIGAPGDILISHKGTVGKVAMVPLDAPPFVCSPQTTFWRTLNREKLDRKYLYAFLRSQGFHEQLVNRAGETDMAPYVSLTSQRSLSVSLPPIGIQRGIADLLGALDDKIELNRRTAETLEAMARAFFKSWFIDFDPVCAKAEGRPTGLVEAVAILFPDSFNQNGLPAGWEITPIEALVEINPLTSLKAGSIAPYVDMAALPTRSARIETWIERAAGSGARFKNNDTLIARITPCLENGKTALVDFLPEGQVGRGSTEFIVLRPRPGVPAGLPYLLARHGPLRAHLIASMSGTSGRQRVPPSALAAWEMAKPDRAVLAAFGQIVNPLFERILKADNERQTLASLRDTLLPRLISGQLRAADAERRIAAA